MKFTQVDVFADSAYSGNQLAVFYDAGDLTSAQMQDIAREMNLSETSFVTSSARDSYEVRIFTPNSELPFAGHPTIGTAWALLDKGIVIGDVLTQRSRAGETRISVEGDRIWMERTGTTEADIETTDLTALGDIAGSLGLEVDQLGLEAREIGRSGRLSPAFADAGLRQFMVPVKDLNALARCVPPVGSRIAEMGTYCFTAMGAGRVKARGLWPGIAVPEDPATGSAAAGLGIYLADRVGEIDLEIFQGEQIGRPSRIYVQAKAGRVRVGGRCVHVFDGTLKTLP